MMRIIIYVILLIFNISTLSANENYSGIWKSVNDHCYYSDGRISSNASSVFQQLFETDLIIKTNGKIKFNEFIGKVRKNGSIILEGTDKAGKKIGKLIGKVKNNTINFKFSDESPNQMYISGSICTYEFKKINTNNTASSKKNTTKKKTEKKFNTSSGIQPGSQEDLIVNVGDRIFFNYDSADLDSDAQELLQDQAAWLNQYSRVRITIEGHADERSTFKYALAIGDKRAIAVKNYLVSLGVDNSRISTISYGNTRPAVIGSNDGAWAQNRRAVTIVD